MIEEKLKEVSDRKSQFEDELKTAALELETLQKAVIKGTANTDALVTAQVKVNTIEQTIRAFDLQLHTLETDLIAQKNLETKKEIFSKIKVLDDDAEKAGRHFIKLYSDTENLSYARFAEMASLAARIADLKADFGRFVNSLIPNVDKLKHRDLPDIETELSSLIAELQNSCKLGVLRSDSGFSERDYATDSDSAFRLPDVPLSDWIWLSIRRVREREREKSTTEKKTGFFQKMFN
jgi:predicted  nucleic acid-binding Zn-ribbon protein